MCFLDIMFGILNLVLGFEIVCTSNNEMHFFLFKAKFLDRLLDIIDISELRYASAKVDSN